MPRPDDPQSFNRYSYARHSPLVRIDPSGHADKSPCEENPSLPFCFPSAPPLLNEQQAGQALAAQQAPVTLNNGAQITLLAAKRESDNKGKGQGGGAGGGLTRLASGICVGLPNMASGPTMNYVES